jgi:hypothetical protein
LPQLSLSAAPAAALEKIEAVGDNLLEMRFLPLLSALALFLGPRSLLANPASDTLDRARIHAEYGDGNFETVIQMLEDHRAQHKDFRRSDSLFLAKYLGVIYASNPASREKGKYWLYRMLQIDPGADLVDMYVGEEVDRTFERVRQEFIVRRNYRGINDLKLAKAIREEDRIRDTVVVRDTVRTGSDADTLPERRLRDFRYGWTGNFNLGVGLKFLDEDEWAATSQQKEMRAALDFRQRRWPINIACDFMYSMSEDVYTYVESSDSYVLYNQTSAELNAGVRKIFDQKLYSMRPFVGGGLGYITTSIDFAEVVSNFQEGTMGAWAEGGVYWELERHFNLGAEVLWSWAKIPVRLTEANAGGKHFEMIVGYHW